MKFISCTKMNALKDYELRSLFLNFWFITYFSVVMKLRHHSNFWKYLVFIHKIIHIIHKNSLQIFIRGLVSNSLLLDLFCLLPNCTWTLICGTSEVSTYSSTYCTLATKFWPEWFWHCTRESSFRKKKPLKGNPP